MRLFYDEYNEKYDSLKIDGYDVYGDIYTYAHVLNRHYFPYMNKGLAATMNDDIPGINIRNLPCSLLMMINLYSHYKHLDKAIEYLLYKIKGSPYILWIKYGKIATLKNREGFEIRSFYKCIEQRDLDKYNGTNDVKIADEIFIAI